MTSTDFVSSGGQGTHNHLLMNEYDQKMKEFEERLKKNPNDFEVYFYRGNYLDGLGLYKRGIEDYSRFLNAVKPLVHTAVLFCRGRALFLLGEYRRAIEDYTDAIRVDPNDSRFFGNRGSAYDEIGEQTKALIDFNEAIRINRNDWETYNNRGNLYSDRGEHNKAIQDFNLAISLQPTFAKAFYNRGNAYRKYEKYGKALLDYNEAIRLKSNYSASYSNRGLVYGILGEYELAIIEYNEVIRLDPNDSDAYNNRGNVYFHLRKFDLAKKDLLTSLSLNPSHEHSLCNIGMLFLKIGDIQKGNEYYKKAVEENPNSPYTYRRRFRETSSTDEERALEDYFRLDQLRKMKSKLQKKGKIGQRHEEVAEVKKIFDRLSSGGNRRKKNFWLPFTEDKRRDEELEKNEIEETKKKITSQTFDQKGTNLRLFRLLGRGVFASTYLCQVVGIPNIFVIKVVQRQLQDEKLNKMKERDCVELPYHRNIAMTLSNFDRTIELDIQKFPDNATEDFKKRQRLLPRKTTISTPLILMKYYRKSLGKYVDQRKKDNASFNPLELCYILKGLLNGVHHLFKNMIVHRDLHYGNVFVDPPYGRIWIGDFGECLDLRKNIKTGFKVKVDKMFETQSSLHNNNNKKRLVITAYQGGAEDYLAPEIVDCEEVDVVDYAKNDLFAVGMLGYFLIDSFKKKKVVAPFGIDRDNELTLLRPICKGRRQEEYVDLEYQDGRISNLIKNLLRVDPTKRIGHEEAIQEIEEIQATYEAPPLLKPKKNDQEESEGEENEVRLERVTRQQEKKLESSFLSQKGNNGEVLLLESDWNFIGIWKGVKVSVRMMRT